MPERLRTIATRLRELVGNRRWAPRRKVRLSAFVSVLDSAAGEAPAGVACHTRDVSDSGLGLILPAIRIGGRYLVGDGIKLRVMLKLPGGSARLYGTPVRYERLEESDPDGGYLVGVHLDADGDRPLLTEYLGSLKG